MKILISATILTLLFSLGAGGVLVSAANAATPGSLFYGLDRGIEDLRLSLTFNPQSAAHLEAELAVERLEEVQKLLEKGETEYVDQALSEAGLLIGGLEEASDPGTGLSSQFITNILNAAFDEEFQQDDNENGNENTNENENGNENEHVTFKQPKSGIHCGGGGGTAPGNHPAGDKLAGAYGVDYTEIMDWFCKGYGFGEINLAYLLSKQSGVPVLDIFNLRGGGMGWGNIMKQYGLIGKGSLKPKNANNPNSGTTLNPTPMPNLQPAGSGNGNGRGNGNGGNGNSGNGNGGGNGGGNGKGKGKP